MKLTEYLVLLCAGFAAFTACSLTGEDPNGPVVPGPGPGTSDGDLVLKVSPQVIQANGTDEALITVYQDGVAVTEGVQLYDGNNSPIDLPDMKFTTTEAGTYSFWASLGTKNTDVVKVTAIDFPVPDLPEDPEPDNASFSRKVLLTQFTGTGCGFCPGMITTLRNIMSDEACSSKFLLAVAHTYNGNDPAYLDPEYQLDQAMGVSNYPYIVADMYLGFNNYNSPAALEMVIDQAYSYAEAKAGIAVSSSLDGNTLVVRAQVKAAETSEYRIGAWLLEDGIKGDQANNRPNTWTGDFNTHDNCIRIADSKVNNIDFTGYTLGTIAAGQTAEHAFVMTLDEEWVKENCHLILFVTVPDRERNAYVVNNAVACSISGDAPYQYEKAFNAVACSISGDAPYQYEKAFD